MSKSLLIIFFGASLNQLASATPRWNSQEVDANTDVETHPMGDSESKEENRFHTIGEQDEYVDPKDAWRAVGVEEEYITVHPPNQLASATPRSAVLLVTPTKKHLKLIKKSLRGPANAVEVPPQDSQDVDSDEEIHPVGDSESKDDNRFHTIGEQEEYVDPKDAWHAVNVEEEYVTVHPPVRS